MAVALMQAMSRGFLVEFPEGKTLFDLIDLEENLKSALGRKVVAYRSLHHLLRDQVLREPIPIL
jgi:predicted nucleotidyltransferase